MLNKSSSINIPWRFSATSRPYAKCRLTCSHIGSPRSAWEEGWGSRRLLYFTGSVSEWGWRSSLLELQGSKLQPLRLLVLCLSSQPLHPPPQFWSYLFCSLIACLALWASHWRLGDGDVKLTETLLLSGDSLNHMPVLSCLEVEVGVLVNVSLADGVESMAH